MARVGYCQTTFPKFLLDWVQAQGFISIPEYLRAQYRASLADKIIAEMPEKERQVFLQKMQDVGRIEHAKVLPYNPKEQNKSIHSGTESSLHALAGNRTRTYRENDIFTSIKQEAAA